MAGQVVSITVPDAYVTEVRQAFQWYLKLDDLATANDSYN